MARPGLATYRKMRDFARSPEPRGNGKKAAGGRSFVVQKHDATRLHYDFRLELDGVLKSWAVPKGPSPDPAEKRLAVQVEDHPVEYGSFEGTIPKGAYGAGTVEIWDRGTWTPEGDAREGIEKGRLKFRLSGRKLRGGWMLVRMQGRAAGNGKENWLLIKERDEKRQYVSAKPPDAAPKRQDGARHRIPVSPGGMPGARKAPLPARQAPELATLVRAVPEGDEWLHETKFDGYRMLGRLEDGKARILSRNGKDWTGVFPSVARAVEALPARTALVDGEIVVLDENGLSDFQALQNALDRDARHAFIYYLFDLPHLDGQDLAEVPLEERKRALRTLLRGAKRSGVLRYSDHHVGDGPEFVKEACRLGLEGVVSKRRTSRYRGGRGREWLKVKCSLRQEFVIGGYTDPQGGRKGLGALLVGVRDGEDLVYAGRVGTGFTEESLQALERRLAKFRRDRSPFHRKLAGVAARGGIHWVEPKLVAEVKFTSWTRDGRLRHPSFAGIREDKDPAEIVREKPAAGAAVPAAAKGRGKAGTHSPAARTRGKAAVKRPAARARGNPGDAAAPRGGATASEVAGVRITHPDRVLYPEGLTKLDVARYYEGVASRMLPFVAGRPLTLRRCPDGVSGACFFQKHGGKSVPPAVRRVPVKAGEDDYLVVDDVTGLVSLVQVGVLEFHVWGARADRLDRPDRLVFDLDPDPAAPWSLVIETSLLLRDLLRKMDLESFLMTTGGKGLHVVVPTARRADWDEAKSFCLDVAQALARHDPEHYTTKASKAGRKGRIFVDWLRNARGATAVAPYSTRARPGATVAVPLAWSEAVPSLAPAELTVSTVPGRLARPGTDPWKGFAGLSQALPRVRTISP